MAGSLKMFTTFLWFASTKLYRQRPLPIKFAELSLSLWKTRKSIGPKKKLLIGSDKLLTQECNSLDDSKCRLLCSLWKLVVWLLMNIAEWFILSDHLTFFLVFLNRFLSLCKIASKCLQIFLNNLFVEIESNLFRENTKVRYQNRKNLRKKQMIAINFTQDQAKIFQWYSIECMWALNWIRTMIKSFTMTFR